MARECEGSLERVNRLFKSFELANCRDDVIALDRAAGNLLRLAKETVTTLDDETESNSRELMKDFTLLEAQRKVSEKT